MTFNLSEITADISFVVKLSMHFMKKGMKPTKRASMKVFEYFGLHVKIVVGFYWYQLRFQIFGSLCSDNDIYRLHMGSYDVTSFL